jgi:hypothetical protein
MSGRPINEDRQNAIDLGLRTYIGARHFKCDTTERYVAGGGCVHCARIVATEQRQARKYLQSHGAELDNAASDGLETESAETRREASFDELM